MGMESPRQTSPSEIWMFWISVAVIAWIRNLSLKIKKTKTFLGVSISTTAGLHTNKLQFNGFDDSIGRFEDYLTWNGVFKGAYSCGEIASQLEVWNVLSWCLKALVSIDGQRWKMITFLTFSRDSGVIVNGTGLPAADFALLIKSNYVKGLKIYNILALQWWTLVSFEHLWQEFLSSYRTVDCTECSQTLHDTFMQSINNWR